MKKKSMIKFSILMFLIFITVFLVSQFGSSIIYAFMTNSKYSMLFICEVLMTLIMIVVLLVSGNKYTFIYKRENFFNSLKLAIPILIFSLFYLFIGLSNIILVQKNFDIFNFVTLILLCTGIGFFEELLCRGWLLNQYLKRFGNTKDGVIKSIVISSIIFGLLHMVNIIGGQPVLLTIMQVIQTTALGFFWGTLYFRTKNIYSCIFIHGFYDFCLMISNINYIKDPIADNGILVSILTTLFLSLAWVSQGIRLFSRKSLKELALMDGVVTNEDIVIDNNNSNKCNIITGISIVLCFVSAALLASTSKVIEFKYEEINMNNYVTHFDHNQTYTINDRIVIIKDKIMGLTIKDKTNNNSVKIDKLISSYGIVSNTNYFEILIFDGTDLYYGKYNYDVDINSIKDNLKKENVPVITNIGYLTNGDNNELEPYFITDSKKEFIIKDGKFYLIK